MKTIRLTYSEDISMFVMQTLLRNNSDGPSWLSVEIVKLNGAWCSQGEKHHNKMRTSQMIDIVQKGPPPSLMLAYKTIVFAVDVACAYVGC